MEFSDRDIKRLSVLLLVLVLAVLVFLLIQPILLSIIGGLILAYAFFPIYRVVLRFVRNKNLSASIVSLLVVILIVVPLYYLVPVLIDQIFGVFQQLSKLNLPVFIKSIFPSASDAFLTQTTVTLENVISKGTSTILNELVNFLLEIPTIAFHFIIVAFVFFFALRDGDKLSEFVSTLSPLNKIQEKKLVKQFKDITNTIVYGQIAVGLIQGMTAGIGFFVFGIPNALVLTILAVIMSIIPVLGPAFVWVPILFFLIAEGSTPVVVAYLLYNLIITSQIDNLFRLYLISKKTELSQVIVLIGMIGGLFIFGILGLLIGPLLLAYFITFLNAYRENTLSSLFKPDKEEGESKDNV